MVRRHHLHDGDVIDFGAWRIKARGSRRYRDSCQHTRLIIAPDEGTLECEDCGKDISPFIAILNWAEQYKAVDEGAARKRREAERVLKEAKSYRPHLRVVKLLERLWRGRKMVPRCPHCGAGLLAEDFDDSGISSVSVDFERERRAALKEGE